MLQILLERVRQKMRTVPYPAALPSLPPRFKGRPFIDQGITWNAEHFLTCRALCPTGALLKDGAFPAIDMGRCLFCGNCATHSPEGSITFTGNWQLAASKREDLIIRAGQATPPEVAVHKGLRKLFRRSYRLRQVSAAGCNACEADLNVLTTIVFDIGRFGIDFVASPRHADGLAITGPVPRNMREALLKCDAAISQPRVVMAFGACAISGGVFSDTVTTALEDAAPAATASSGLSSAQCTNTVLKEQPQSHCAYGVPPLLDVDLFIPGCPPHPYTSLDGMLRLLGVIQ